MGNHYVLDFVPALRFLQIRFCADCKKGHICMLKILLVHVRVQWTVEITNNPTCTKGVRVFIMLKLDTIQKKNIIDFFPQNMYEVTHKLNHKWSRLT